MYLYHYYDKTVGPFRNIVDNTKEEAEKILEDIKLRNTDTQCAMRYENYLEDRLYYEEILRNKFLQKGGRILRKNPYYMVVEHSPWLSSCYDNCGIVKIPVEEFDLSTISFTYGDSHSTFSSKGNDDKEYRNKIYLYGEMLELIEKYGLPQDWNDDGKFGPERYIEVHIWSDDTIRKYK